MGIDPSALGDGRGLRMIIRSPHGKRVAWNYRTAFSGWAPRKHRLNGTNYVPPREVLVGRIRSPFSIPWPDSRALVREAGTRLVWNRGAPPVEMDSRSIGLGRYE